MAQTDRVSQSIADIISSTPTVLYLEAVHSHLIYRSVNGRPYSVREKHEHCGTRTSHAVKLYSHGGHGLDLLGNRRLPLGRDLKAI
jgi:hypothetical protein